MAELLAPAEALPVRGEYMETSHDVVQVVLGESLLFTREHKQDHYLVPPRASHSSRHSSYQPKHPCCLDFALILSFHLPTDLTLVCRKKRKTRAEFWMHVCDSMGAVSQLFWVSLSYAKRPSALGSQYNLKSINSCQEQ